MSKAFSYQRGFTLMELASVVLISGAVAMLGMPLVQNYQQQNQLNSLQQRLAESLAGARAHAVATGQPVAVCASADGQNCADVSWARGWLVYQPKSSTAQVAIASKGIAEEDLIERFQNPVASYELSVRNENAAAVAQIRFDGQGFNSAQQRVVALVCADTKSLGDAVVVERTGRVRLGDAPAGAEQCALPSSVL